MWKSAGFHSFGCRKRVDIERAEFSEAHWVSFIEASERRKVGGVHGDYLLGDFAATVGIWLAYKKAIC
jgi:hypothetical protein